MSKVEKSRLLWFESSPSSVSETGGCVVEDEITIMNGGDVRCLLHSSSF